jgi:hypothetical protein
VTNDVEWTNVQTCDPIPCEDVGGFILSCSSDDASSAWNFIKTDLTSWVTSSASAPQNTSSSTTTTPPSTTPPTGTTTGSCANVADWVDAAGDGCDFYEVVNATGEYENCDVRGEDIAFQNDGLLASQACCACGGGVNGAQPAYVECKFTFDNLVTGLYLDGVDNIDKLPGSLDEWRIPKSWSFYDLTPELGSTVALAALDFNEDDCPNHEECAGFYLGCTSTDISSPWNYLKSDLYTWIGYSSSDPNALSATNADGIPIWVTNEFDPVGWYVPIQSTSPFTCQECTDFRNDAIPTWADDGTGHGSRYAWFRSAVCGLEVPNVEGYEFGVPTARVLGSPLETTCALGYIATNEFSPAVCDATGSWSPPSGCEPLPEVTCTFATQRRGVNLYVDNVDVTDQVVGDLEDSSVVKTFTFNPTGVAEVLGMVVESELCGTANPSAASLLGPAPDQWYSNTTDPATLSFQYPVNSGSSLACDSCDADAENIWGLSVDGAALQYAWFRTAVCNYNNVGHDYFVFSDTATELSKTTDTRTVECDAYSTGAGDTVTCLENGLWSTPANACVPDALVTCHFNADDYLRGMYMDDNSLLSDVIGDPLDSDFDKSVSFPERSTGSQSLSALIQNIEPCGLGGCDLNAGFVISCESTDPDSPWNFVQSDQISWRTTSVSTIALVSSESVATDWFVPEFDDAGWTDATVSFSDITCATCDPAADTIWADQGKQFGYFRTGVCSEIVPEPAGYEAIDGEFVCADSTISGGADWYDSGGTTFDCEWYGSYYSSTSCATIGDSYPNFGLTANQACCVCGGGTNVVDAALRPNRYIGYERGMVCASGYEGDPTPSVCLTTLEWSEPTGCTVSPTRRLLSITEEEDVAEEDVAEEDVAEEDVAEEDVAADTYSSASVVALSFFAPVVCALFNF